MIAERRHQPTTLRTPSNGARPSIAVKGKMVPLDQAPAFLELADARRILGWSKSKMRRAVLAGVLPGVIRAAGIRTCVSTSALIHFAHTGQSLAHTDSANHLTGPSATAQLTH